MADTPPTPDTSPPAASPLPNTVDQPPGDPAEMATLAPTSSPTEEPLPVRPGRFVGDYELLGEIARGGMGVVYRAREQHSGLLVALKMMLGETADQGELRRFILEARATGELNHPGV